MENMLKKMDEMIRQKDRELEAKERELEKFRCEFKKLQKLQDLKPTMMFPIGHTEKDIKHMKDKKKGFFEKMRPSTPYISWSKDRWNKIKGKKFYEEKDQEVYIEVLWMGLNRLKHEMKVTNERVNRMSSNLKILRGEMLNTKTELSEKKEKETKGQNELTLQKFKDHKTQWKVIAGEATEDGAIEPSTYEEASQYAEWRKTVEESKSNISTANISKLREILRKCLTSKDETLIDGLPKEYYDDVRVAISLLGRLSWIFRCCCASVVYSNSSMSKSCIRSDDWGTVELI
ncbi:high mobility group B protein 13-like [Eucalyptus grandis]|uniref:high mobility group B protein 13-like n=1 Tax=Eucalyptus grandis TaxID=71139 RepID=UPI00192E9857|nr:high mobility group B protein 13-like [Eucalyptus grandis]